MVNEYDEADKVNEATALDEAVDAGIISFSLTKCSAIFTEVKEYFEANNNQTWTWIRRADSTDVPEQ
jgi:hypothetical protein